MSKVKLPKEFRTKWLKALTNGSYKQTASMLVETIKGQKNRYCCLGVACRIEGIPVKQLKDEGMPNTLLPKYKKILPAALFKRNRLRDSNSTLATKLANLNDGGRSFKEIAEYIEKHTVAA